MGEAGDEAASWILEPPETGWSTWELEAKTPVEIEVAGHDAVTGVAASGHQASSSGASVPNAQETSADDGDKGADLEDEWELTSQVITSEQILEVEGSFGLEDTAALARGGSESHSNGSSLELEVSEQKNCDTEEGHLPEHSVTRGFNNVRPLQATATDDIREAAGAEAPCAQPHSDNHPGEESTVAVAPKAKVLLPPSSVSSAFRFLPPPPAPLSAVGTPSPKAEDVLVVDTLAEALAAATAIDMDDREDSAAPVIDDDSDDCGGLLGSSPKAQERRPRAIDDGIDSMSESENEGSPAAASAVASAVVPLSNDAMDNNAGADNMSGGLRPPTPTLPKPVVDNSLPASEKPPTPTQSLGFPGFGSCEVDSSNFAKSTSAPITTASGNQAFVVKVPKPFPGLQYRRSKVLSQRLSRYAKDGSVVHGVLEGDGAWLKVGEGLFLPSEVSGTRVLEPATGAGIAAAAAAEALHHRSAGQQTRVPRPCSRHDNGDAPQWCPEIDCEEGEETVPDEGPRDIPRASFHRAPQPGGARWGPSTFLQHSPPKGSAAGLPPRMSSGTNEEEVLHVPDPERVRQQCRPEVCIAESFLKDPSSVLSADAYEDAMQKLLLKPVDPFADDILEPQCLARAKDRPWHEQRTHLNRAPLQIPIKADARKASKNGVLQL